MGRRDATPIFFDRINMMDMMPTDRRDVYADSLDMVRKMIEVIDYFVCALCVRPKKKLRVLCALCVR